MNATLELSSAQPAGSSVTDEPLFETKGIDHIPLAKRNGVPRDLTWMWAGRCSTSDA